MTDLFLTDKDRLTDISQPTSATAKILLTNTSTNSYSQNLTENFTLFEDLLRSISGYSLQELLELNLQTLVDKVLDFLLSSFSAYLQDLGQETLAKKLNEEVAEITYSQQDITEIAKKIWSLLSKQPLFISYLKLVVNRISVDSYTPIPER